jgi:hypothetical protein
MHFICYNEILKSHELYSLTFRRMSLTIILPDLNTLLDLPHENMSPYDHFHAFTKILCAISHA